VLVVIVHIAADNTTPWCISQAVTCLRHAKTAQGIDALFEVETFGDQRNIVLDGGLDPFTERGDGSMRLLHSYFGHLLKSLKKAKVKVILML